MTRSTSTGNRWKTCPKTSPPEPETHVKRNPSAGKMGTFSPPPLSLFSPPAEPSVFQSTTSETWKTYRTLGGSTQYKSNTGQSWVEAQTLGGSKRYRSDLSGSTISNESVFGGASTTYRNKTGQVWESEQTLGGTTRYRRTK